MLEINCIVDENDFVKFEYFESKSGDFVSLFTDNRVIMDLEGIRKTIKWLQEAEDKINVRKRI